LGIDAPPSAVPAATSPSQVDGEELARFVPATTDGLECNLARSSPSTRDGEVARAQRVTEGSFRRLAKPAHTVQRAKKLRKAMSLPEVLLWKELKSARSGLHWRKQHAADAYVLDFFCGRANLAIEVDGFAHDTGNRPQKDDARDAYLKAHRIDTLRIPARDVLRDPGAVAESVIALALDRLDRFGKPPPSSLRDATSPSRVDGEDQQRSRSDPTVVAGTNLASSSPSTCDGEVAAGTADRGVL
jgi:very-short-patch-repair endonuclease